MNSDRVYELEISEEQGQLIIEALDLYSRIGLTQFIEIAYHMPHLVENVNPPKGTYDVGLEIEDKLHFLKPADFNKNTSYGIFSPEVPLKVKLAFDILRVIRHRIAWTNNPRGNSMSVAFDEPDFCRTVPETIRQAKMRLKSD